MEQEPKWFETFRKDLTKRLDHIESDIKELKLNQKLMMNTPTMKKELKQT